MANKKLRPGPTPVPTPAATARSFHVSAVITAPGMEKTVEADIVVSDSTPPAPEAEPPSILTHPLSTTIAPGENATLAVAAAGTEPLGYQWHNPIDPIPNATAPTYATGPLTQTAEYVCTVANAAGSANSNPARVTVDTIPIPEPPAGLGLTFIRTIGLPSLNMSWAYGDCTGRVVNGKPRLLFSGDNVGLNSPIFEVEITDAPVATYVQTWSDPYNGKRGTWIQGSAALDTADALDREAKRLKRPHLAVIAAWFRRLGKKTPRDAYTWVDFATAATPALNGGHFYHPDLDLLFVTYADSYNVAGRPDWNCVGIRLHPDGTADTWGPWRLASRDGEGTIRQGPRGAMYLRPHPISGMVTGATTLGSGNVGYPWGANLVGGAPWPTPALPAGPHVPDVQLFDCYLFHYYMGTSVDPVTGIAHGPVRSQRRARDPYIYESFPGVQANNVDPAQYQGVGSWGDLDVIGGFEPFPDRVLFFGAVSGSPIQDPTNPLAAHCFYSNEINHYTCNHGYAAVPPGITGPTSTARFPFGCAYAAADLDKVRRGLAVDWQLEPMAFSNLETDYGIVTAPINSVGNAKLIAGGFFHAATRRLYTIAQGADQGQVTWGLINAAIHEWAVA